MSHCPLAWVERMQQLGVHGCPYGSAFVSVTWPDPAKAIEIYHKYENSGIEYQWISDNFVQNAYFTALFVMYGYVPYLIIVVAVVKLLWSPSTKLLSFLGFALSSCLLNEVVLKNAVQQHRPEYSCVTSCGMPSGHSTLAMGYFTLVLLDLLFRIYYMPKYSILDSLSSGGMTRARLKEQMGHLQRAVSITPLAAGVQNTHSQVATSMLFWTVLLVPVPLSRIAVGDHTPSQALIGSALGVLEASAYTLWMRYLLYKHKNLAGKVYHICGRTVTHNYALPWFVYESATPSNERSAVATAWYLEQDTQRDRQFARTRALLEEGTRLDQVISAADQPMAPLGERNYDNAELAPELSSSVPEEERLPAFPPGQVAHATQNVAAGRSSIIVCFVVEYHIPDDVGGHKLRATFGFAGAGESLSRDCHSRDNRHWMIEIKLDMRTLTRNGFEIQFEVINRDNWAKKREHAAHVIGPDYWKRIKKEALVYHDDHLKGTFDAWKMPRRFDSKKHDFEDACWYRNQNHMKATFPASIYRPVILQLKWCLVHGIPEFINSEDRWCLLPETLSEQGSDHGIGVALLARQYQAQKDNLEQVEAKMQQLVADKELVENAKRQLEEELARCKSKEKELLKDLKQVRAVLPTLEMVGEAAASSGS